MLAALRRHWPEYLMEAGELGLFMFALCLVGTVVWHPSSLISQTIPDPFLRRLLMGSVMGLTAIGIVYSPWGQQSGAHFNPSVTLAFFRLGKISAQDAAGYIIAQFLGGLAGVLIAAVLMRHALAHPAVNYMVTLPGPAGMAVAFVAEVGLAFGLMSVILVLTNTRHLARWTGVAIGLLIACYVALAAPLSGMSINPARTLGSALPAQTWSGWWVYFTAPVLGSWQPRRRIYACVDGGWCARSSITKITNGASSTVATSGALRNRQAEALESCPVALAILL